MHVFVAIGTPCDQVLFDVATRMAPELEVVHLQVVHTTAYLASPAIALQHLLMQFAVAGRV